MLIIKILFILIAVVLIMFGLATVGVVILVAVAGKRLHEYMDREMEDGIYFS